MENNKERNVSSPKERKKYSTPVLYTMGVWQTLGGKGKGSEDDVRAGKTSS